MQLPFFFYDHFGKIICYGYAMKLCGEKMLLHVWLLKTNHKIYFYSNGTTSTLRAGLSDCFDLSARELHVPNRAFCSYGTVWNLKSDEK
jgi:hypothetical protein